VAAALARRRRTGAAVRHIEAYRTGVVPQSIFFSPEKFTDYMCGWVRQHWYSLREATTHHRHYLWISSLAAVAGGAAAVAALLRGAGRAQARQVRREGLVELRPGARRGAYDRAHKLSDIWYRRLLFFERA
jgi:hypothetical protein